MLPEIVYFGITLFLGLCLGSFATALSWRIPRGISVSIDRSKCTKCQRTLGIADLVPVFSWLFLRGKCRTCRAPVSWRYPAIEVATVLLCVALYARFGFSASTLIMFCLAPAAVAATSIDLEHKILPDSLNLSILLTGIAALIGNALVTGDPPAFIVEHGENALWGVALYGLGSAALRQGGMAVMKREPLGFGDVKFFGAAGFWLGTNIEVLAWFLFLSGFLGIGIALLWRKVTGDPQFPFGPAIILAFIVMLIAEPPPFVLFNNM